VADARAGFTGGIAVKVIKPGKSPSEDVFTGQCRRCGCVVECTRAEAKFLDGDRPGEPGAHYVTCPTPQCDEPYLWLKEHRT